MHCSDVNYVDNLNSSLLIKSFFDEKALLVPVEQANVVDLTMPAE